MDQIFYLFVELLSNTLKITLFSVDLFFGKSNGEQFSKIFCIDNSSKYLISERIRNKKPSEIIKAFGNILRKIKCVSNLQNISTHTQTYIYMQTSNMVCYYSVAV